MESSAAVRRLSALAQETRLAIFRLLVQVGPDGLTVGQICERLSVPNATLSFHLKELVHAGLVTTRQQSRYVRCHANFEAMGALLTFLTENCCAGQPCPASQAACDCPPELEPTAAHAGH
jgi:DNA-binding transcriptional ArsR family regulator